MRVARLLDRRQGFGAAIEFAAVAGCVVMGALIVRPMVRPAPSEPARPAVRLPQQPLAIDGAPALGTESARVVMVAFSDFECPFCARFASQVLPLIKARYLDTGRVQLVFRNRPLPRHTRARQAAEIAVCAHDQHKFWQTHDLFFGRGGRLSDLDLRETPQVAALDTTLLSACMSGPGARAVERDVESADALDLRETPAFLIGVRRDDGRVQVRDVTMGLQPLEVFEQAFEAAEKEDRRK